MLLNILNLDIPGGWSILPIIACSLVSITIIIYKLLDLRRADIVPESLESVLQNVANQVPADPQQLERLQALLRQDKSVLGRICRHALRPEHASREDAARSTESVAREEVSRLENWISTLEAIFTIAPMIGLMGTANGMVLIFGNFGAKTQTTEQTTLIAKGISEALICTLAGLGVAVIAYLFQVYFVRKVEILANRMATLVTGLISAAFRPVDDEK